MHDIVNRYLSEVKLNWLLSALIETIVKDSTISGDTELQVLPNKKTKKEQLLEVTQINLECFFISVLNYILLYKKENTLGKKTFETWYTHNSAKSPWKFTYESLGSTVNKHIEILRYKKEANEKALDESKTKVLEVEPEIITEEKQNTDRLTQIVNNPKIVNQYATNIYNIEHVEHLD